MSDACDDHAERGGDGPPHWQTDQRFVLRFVIKARRSYANFADNVYIDASLPCVRSDKRPDRVEISDEQMSKAMIYAQGLPVGVVQWVG